MRPDFELPLARASLRLSAAGSVFDARLQDFYASLMVGSEDERRRCREAVLSAQESVLDAHEFNAWLLLEQRGIDPQQRHL